MNASKELAYILDQLKAFSLAQYLRDIPPHRLDAAKLANLLASIEEEKAGTLIVSSKPSFFNIEPTNHCNLRCALCPTGLSDASIRKGYMPLDRYKRIVDQACESALVINLHNWGEPTLHPHLPEMIRYAAAKNIWTVVSTNFSQRYPPGYFEELLQSGLGVLHIDLDGTDAETYRHYRRGGDFDQVMKNTREVVALKRRLGLTFPLIEGTMLVMRHNEGQCAAFIRLCEEMGLDRYFLSKLQVDPATTKDWLPLDPSLSYANYFKDDPAPPCSRLYSFMVINWSCNLAACCLTYDEASDFANVADEPLWQIWNNERFQSARAVFHPDGHQRPATICHCCRNRLGSPELPRYKTSFALALPRTRSTER